MNNLSDVSNENESDISVIENEDLCVDKLSIMKDKERIFSEECGVISEIDNSEMISISLEDDNLHSEAEIDTFLSLGNDRKMHTVDSEECNVNFTVSVIREDHNSQSEMNVSDVTRKTDISIMYTSDISCSEAEVDSILSLRNDPKISTRDSEESDELDSILSLRNDPKISTRDSEESDEPSSECETNMPISLENDSLSKASENSISSLVNDQDSGVIGDDGSNNFDTIMEEDTVSDKIQSVCTFEENVDTSVPPGSEQDSGVVEDAPNDKLNLFTMEEEIVPDKDQTLDNTDDNADSLPPVENELDLIKDIIEDFSEDEALLSHQTEAANELDPEEPLSPKQDELNEVSDTLERENKSRSSKDLTLPYFKLPKPDLDEFLAETEKNLQISLPTSETILRKEVPSSLKTKLEKNSFFNPKKTFTTHDPRDDPPFITIDLDLDYSKLSNKDASKKKVQIAEIESETSCKTVKNEYEEVVSSLNKDETDVPGIKRLAFKEFLKKQIDQKRYEAFCHSNSLAKEDEEMEEDGFIEEEEAANTEEEDSAEEEEEATVTFENLNRKEDIGSDGEDENMSQNEPGDGGTFNAEESDNESDDDFIGVRKAKKKFLVLEEDEDEGMPNEYKSSLENTSPFEPKLTKGVRNDIESDDDMNDGRDIGQSKNSQPAFREDFQLNEKSNGLSQISSSMPSFQPGGGFNQEIVLEDSSDSSASLPSLKQLQGDVNEDSQDSVVQYQPEENILRKSPSNSVLGRDVVVQNSILSPKNDKNMHHIKLDDLPISQADNDSDIFATNELADVCSGAFKGDDFNELTEEAGLSQTNAESGTATLRRLEDVLKYPPPKEKYEPEPEPEPEEKITDFFDVEAELSGEDDGIDEKEEDSEDDNLVLHPSDEEDLPEDEVLREEIADLHMKRILNDDAEYLKEIQEKFLDDGELNTDGAGRSRRFAWINNDTDIGPVGNNSDSDSDADVANETFSSINEEKAKWRQENKDDENEDITEELNSSGCRRKSFLKVNIVGKPKFSQEEDKAKRLSGKRPRGSFLNLDDSSASQVLKKLKASEDNMGGSRTTKHFVFRNELADPEVSECIVINNEFIIFIIYLQTFQLV